MSFFHRPKPLMSGTSSSCKQTNEPSKVCLSPPLSLSSPVIKKKAILIPSFDDKVLIFEKGNTKLSAANRSNDVISSKTLCQLMRGKECPNSQRNYGERPSTHPRAKASTHSRLTTSAKPNICISPAPQPNSSPTLPTFKPRPKDSLLLPASDFYPIQHQQDPKPRVSPTLTVPTPRLSPSPSSANNSQQERQPFPVAQKRHARSISISNMTAEPSEKIKHEVLDQGTLMDFTHPGQTGVCREARHQSESYRLPATCHNSCIAQSKTGLKKTEITSTEKPKTLNRSSNIATTSKPKPITKQQKQCELREVTRRSDVFPPVLDFPSRLRSRLADYNLRSNYTHTCECIAVDQSFEHTDPSKRTKFTKLSLSTDSQMNLNSDKSETRRRQYDLDTETNAPSLNSKCPQNQRSVPNQTLSQSTQKDVNSTVSWSEHASEDFSCQSSDFSQTLLTSSSAQRLNQVKTCMLASQTLGTSQSAFDESLYSQYGSFSNADIQPKCLWIEELTKPHDNQKEINVSHTVLNQIRVFKTPDHNVGPTTLLEYPRVPSEAGFPFSTNRSGDSSKRVSDWQQRIVYQPSEETTTQGCQQKHQPDYSVPHKAFITEDSEDPYYVTMYYPDSVYVGEFKNVQNM